MKNPFRQKKTDGRHSLEAVITRTGDGLNVYLGGGEEPHIGTVVISQPRPSLTGNGEISCTTSVFNFMGHKDDGLGVPLAEALCRNLNRNVVVTAGVHIEKATSEDLQRLNENLAELTKQILHTLAEG